MPATSPPTGPAAARVFLISIFVLLQVLAVRAQTPLSIMNQPPVSDRPYPTAFYNQKLPGAGSGGPLNHLMPNSDAVAQTTMTNGTGSLVTLTAYWNTPGTDDGQHTPIYYGQSTDPVYQVSGCTGPAAATAVNGMKFHAPSAAPYNQGSFDREIAIWDLPSNTIFAFNGGSGGPKNLPVCTNGTMSNPCNMPAYQYGGCSAQKRDTGSGVDGGTGAGSAGISPFWQPHSVDRNDYRRAYQSRLAHSHCLHRYEQWNVSIKTRLSR